MYNLIILCQSEKIVDNHWEQYIKWNRNPNRGIAIPKGNDYRVIITCKNLFPVIGAFWYLSRKVKNNHGTTYYLKKIKKS